MPEPPPLPLEAVDRLETPLRVEIPAVARCGHRGVVTTDDPLAETGATRFGEAVEEPDTSDGAEVEVLHVDRSPLDHAQDVPGVGEARGVNPQALRFSAEAELLPPGVLGPDVRRPQAVAQGDTVDAGILPVIEIGFPIPIGRKPDEPPHVERATAVAGVDRRPHVDGARGAPPRGRGGEVQTDALPPHAVARGGGGDDRLPGLRLAVDLRDTDGPRVGREGHIVRLDVRGLPRDVDLLGDVGLQEDALVALDAEPLRDGWRGNGEVGGDGRVGRVGPVARPGERRRAGTGLADLHPVPVK